MGDVVRQLEAAREAFARHPAIAVAYVFGSHARGDARSDSDLDIGLVYLRDLGSGALHEQIADDLTIALGSATGIDAVDVVDLEAQGPIFIHHVLCEGRRVYVRDEARRVDFESDAIVNALDFRPTYDLATQDKPAALRRWLRKHHDVGSDPIQARHPEG